jgi:murein DD-endopeptidase MepM/ murein hydrolase activator NlpD
MSCVTDLLSARHVPQVAVLALMSLAFAGCSADMQTRLSQAPNFATNPGQGPRAETTGSVNAVPAGGVERRELPQYARPQYSAAPVYQSQPLAPPPVAAPQSYPVAQQSYPAPPARPMPSYAAPARPAIENTASVAPRPAAANGVLGQNGGTPIIVGTSDTLEGLAKRYNVSTAAILAANGYRGPRTLQPGQSLIIPRQQVAAAPAPAPMTAPVAAPAVAAARPAMAAASVHVVNSGDTLAGVARRNHISVAELARANGMTATSPLKIGAKLNVPSKMAATAPVVAPANVNVAAPAAAPVRMAAAAPAAIPAPPVEKARLASAAPSADPPAAAAAAETPVKTAEATGALPTFRWPVRGRVITSYGSKTNGKANDGINVAVPEGTPVKAAEDGVVAYAGNELKGYGNLVLVRHSNGYVTAYAHASELMVKRGETIKRGQTIAKSGQSGEVTSPQLHFEIRKGATPVDPLTFLNGA